METLELFAVRDREGNLKLFTDDSIIKNPGRGYWLPEYNNNVQMGEMTISKDSFPEIQWDDSRPTKLLLINPESEDDELNDDVTVPGCIEVHVDDHTSNSNLRVDSELTVFINDISFLENKHDDRYKCIIHLKSGKLLPCRESVNDIKRSIHENS